MYEWRKMTDNQRREILLERKSSGRPLHRPPHYDYDDRTRFHLSAACFEHKPFVGESIERLSSFSNELVDFFCENGVSVFAWCVLPNHWHALIETDDLRSLINQVSMFHGRLSFNWNSQDKMRGRKCWHGCADRRIRSDSHFFAVRNYINNNPVKHGYVEKWEEWPFSSAQEYIDSVGRDEAVNFWKQYPVLDMGKGWDEL